MSSGAIESMATKKRIVVRRVPAGTRVKARRVASTAGEAQRSKEVEMWILREVQAQERLYRRIVREMNALNDRRIRWVRDFYERLQTRGFSVHAGLRRKVRADEIPKVPKRIRVVF